jgi:hypothetical protein
MIMFLAAVSLIGLSVSGGGGAQPITVNGLAGLAMGVVLAASGVEALRRRHYWFALLGPAVMAVLNLGYALSTGVYQAIVTAVMFGIAAVLVALSKEDFE